MTDELEIKDPITGEVVKLASEEKKEEVSETVEEVKEPTEAELKAKAKEEKRLQLMAELEKAQDGRPFSEIPLSDIYWEKRNELHLHESK